MILMVLPDSTTEDSLLERLQAGDDDAVIAIYEQFFTPLYQYLRMKSGDAALAEDIASDVFVKLIASQGKKSAPHSSLRGWLFRVARNELYRQLGKMRQLPVADLEEWMPDSPEGNPEVQVDKMMDLERVRHALRMLKIDQQEVLILRFGQRLSLQETSDMMGKSVSAIKSLQFRAVDTLRQILLQPQTEVANG